ncbi:MAG: glutathione peroxidase [Oscillospiraceae bacterium]
MSFYEFKATDNKGAEVSLDAFSGKVVLVVNTATKCGLTPQYEALESLYQKYKDQGLEILDFPCNQFMSQAPGSDEEIQSFCTLNYNTTFPRFAKIDVNGENAHPLYTWLKAQAPKDKGNAKTAAFELVVKPLNKTKEKSDVKWNFGKFLISKTGVVAARYSPAYEPEKLEADIVKLLGE